jgi:RHH-type rel operon transcriptional repressor/antitoxin RelB
MMAQISIRVKDELLKRLNNLAERTGRSKTYYVTEAVKKHLKNLEKIYLLNRSLKTFARAKKKNICA